MKHSPTYTPIREDYQRFILEFIKDKDKRKLRCNLTDIIDRLKRIAIPNAEDDLPDAEEVVNYTDEEFAEFNANFLSRYFNLGE